MKTKLSVLGLIVALGLGVFTSNIIASGGNKDKVTICHAAGREGTTHFVTLTISKNAVFGPGGHFNENGTTQAGHEQDYMGPCEDEEETEPPVTETETTPPSTPCPITPQNPTGSLPDPPGGKDGKPGNDDCKPDEVPPVETTSTPVDTGPVTPPVTTTPIVVTPTPTSEKPVTAPKPNTVPTQNELEEQLEKQAKNNGANNITPVKASELETLPNTGIPLGLTALLGAGLIGSGLWMRRKGL